MITALIFIAIFVLIIIFFPLKKKKDECEHEKNMFIGSTTNDDFRQFKKDEVKKK